MDTTIITTLVAAAATATAVVALVSRSIGNLRNHMDQKLDAQGARIDDQGAELRARIDSVRAGLGKRIDSVRAELGKRIDTLTHANQQAHESIGLRIDTQGAELGKRIDDQGARIDGVEARLSRISDDVAFIRGWLTAQPED